ncbi:hypothetical protein VB834_08810 [Limnoraphis robusta Tam1]|uniref:hypothetical protein n=1 Tax=Limnoraphis robusta TaxID=1118279 RepID=UPI002B1ED06F|nr:hypothetical protein [Limnoraphis robusta]MEA5539131.1 hypothetical protein [Limnoraphis robusta Tam1]
MLLKFSVRFPILPSSSNGSLSRTVGKFDHRRFRLVNPWQAIKIESALVGSRLRLQSSNLGLSLL